MGDTFPVTFLPAGVSIEDAGRRPLLTLARLAGVRIETACGGRGICRTCAVRISSGGVPAPTASDVEAFTAEELAAGWRRACRTTVSGPCDVLVPLRSAGGFVTSGQHDPGDEAVPVQDPVWCPDARRSDAAPGHPAVGIAVDLGTTSIAASLVDLVDGRVLARAAALNPQTALGADVISRIEYALRGPDRGRTLQALAVSGIAAVARRLTRGHPERIAEIAVCGNTVMQHLLLGLPVDSLAAAPYTPAVLEAVETSASGYGLAAAPGAGLYVAPSVAGFLGGDHVCALLDRAPAAPEGPWLLLDIGTNTEIALVHGPDVTSVSCASGPAFEGGRVSCGMRAAPGAVDAVRFDGDAVVVSTIAGRTPVGICGSGVLSVVAALKRVAAVDQRGRLRVGPPWVRERLGTREVVLHDAADDTTALPVVFTQADVRNVQLAKGAVRTGLDLLLDRAGRHVADLSAVMLAGAFGRFIDPQEAIRIGLLPEVPVERVHRVGNAAAAGVRRTLVCRAARRQAWDLARRIRYLELASCVDFQRTYARRCLL